MKLGRELNVKSALALWQDAEGESTAGWRRFLDLYEAEVGGDRLFEADVADASFFVGQFTWRQLLEHDYRAAEVELKRFFTHPHAEQIRSPWEFKCRLAFCSLGQGEEAVALAAFRSILALAAFSEKLLIASFIRNGLGARVRGVQGLGPDWPKKGLASEERTGFVEELSATLRGGVPRRKRFPSRTSYAKLRRCLLRTYPPYPYAHVDLTGCDVLEAAHRMCAEAVRQIRAEPLE